MESGFLRPARRAGGRPWTALIRPRLASAQLGVVLAACSGRSALLDTGSNDPSRVDAGFGGSRSSLVAGDSSGPDGASAADARSCNDTLADPKNCGRCGHDCQGGACTDGVCQPVNLGPATACAIALDATNVYWVSGRQPDPDKLTKLPVTGGPPVALADGSGQVTGIAVDAVNLYWSQATPAGPGVNRYTGLVNKVPLHGGVATTLATETLRPSAIAVEGGNVYYTTSWLSTFDPNDQVPRGAVVKVPIGGGTPVALATGLQEAVAIAIDSTRVYWAAWFGAGCSWGCAMAVPLGGGTPTTLVSNGTTTQANIPAIAVTATDIYWASATVMRSPLGGGAPVAMAAGKSGPRAIAVDATAVFWAGEAGDIMSARRDGGGAITLAVDQCSPCAIAVDEASVYWITCDSLMRVAKAP